MPRRDRIVWVLLGAAALGLRALAAAVRRPWHDEYFTAWVSGLSWGDMLAALRLDSGPPLLYAVVKAAGAAGWDPLLAARTVAVASGTAAVFVAARAVRRVAGTASAQLAAALLAVHPLAIAWGSEGRAYALLLLATTLAWERLESLRQHARGLIGLAAAVALACWSHGLGLVLAVAAAAACLALPAAARRRGLGGVALGLAAFSPWIPIMAAQPTAAVAWMSDAWRAVPLPDRLASPLRLVSPLASFGDYLDLPSAPLVLQAAGLVALAALLLAAPRRTSAWPLAAVSALGLPIAAGLGLPLYFPGRGEALWLAPLLGLAAAGAAGVRWRRFLAGGLLVASLAVALAATREWAGTPPRREEVVARALATALPDGGTIVASGYWWLDLSYHLHDAAEFRLLPFPQALGRHPGWVARDVGPPTASELIALERELDRARGRVAVVTSPGLAPAAGLDGLGSRLGLVPLLSVPGGVVHVPAPRPL